MSDYRHPERFQPITWHPLSTTTDAKQKIQLQNRDISLLWILARDDYATTNQLMHAGFEHRHSLNRRLAALSTLGYIQTGHMLWTTPPIHKINVYSLTDEGANICHEDDPELWDTIYTGWSSPLNGMSSKRHVLHELGRNEILWQITDDCYSQQWPILWEAGQKGHVRIFPHGPASERIELTPDAVITINEHVWLIEYERSWRPDTLVSKMQRYSRYFHHQGWREKFVVPPRILFILAEESTQGMRQLDSWIEQAQALEYSRLYVYHHTTPDLDSNEPLVSWPVWHWNPLTHERSQASWLFDYNSPKTKEQK